MQGRVKKNLVNLSNLIKKVDFFRMGRLSVTAAALAMLTADGGKNVETNPIIKKFDHRAKEYVTKL